MKNCIYCALAVLALTAGSAQASDCGCPPHKIVHHTVVRHAPMRHDVRHEVFHEDADAEYAQSYYDYHSTSTVEEVYTSTAEQHGPWQIAPDDAQIRFHDQMAYDEAGYGDAGFTGGVGDYEGAVGYGGYGNRDGFRDGYGQMHFFAGGAGFGASVQAGGFVQGRFDFGRGGVGGNFRRGGNGR